MSEKPQGIDERDEDGPDLIEAHVSRARADEADIKALGEGVAKPSGTDCAAQDSSKAEQPGNGEGNDEPSAQSGASAEALPSPDNIAAALIPDHPPFAPAEPSPNVPADATQKAVVPPSAEQQAAKVSERVSAAQTEPKTSTTKGSGTESKPKHRHRGQSLGMAWLQHKDSVRDRKPFFKMAVAFAFVCTVIVSADLWLPLVLPSKPTSQHAEPDYGELETRAFRKQGVLADMEKAQKEALTWQPSPNPVGKSRGAMDSPQTRQDTVKKRTIKRLSKGKHVEVAESEPSDPVREKYEAIFGPSGDLRAMAIKSGGHKEASEKASDINAATTRGLVLRAELLTAVASAPTNAAVIAALTKPTRIGDQTFPAGTQFHGEVRPGDQSPRVFVEFIYARFADGRTIDLNAVATDLRGREGIPGVRPMTGRTAGSVGLSGGQAAMRTGASAIPGVGGVVASGAAAMVDAFADKSQRLDRDEVIVQVDVRTAILIYVRSISLS